MIKRLVIGLFMIPYCIIIILMMFIGVLTVVPIYWVIVGRSGFDEFTDRMYHIMTYPISKQ